MTNKFDEVKHVTIVVLVSNRSDDFPSLSGRTQVSYYSTKELHMKDFHGDTIKSLITCAFEDLEAKTK